MAFRPARGLPSRAVLDLDLAAAHEPEGGFVLALARGGPRELELDRPVRRG
jgi:hypothetical protein